MNNYLLDTNVVSEIRKIGSGKANQRLAQWAKQTQADRFYLSVISLLEIKKGILKLNHRGDINQANLLTQWFEQAILPTFQQRILAIDSQTALLSSTFFVPNPRPLADMLIAATAIQHQLILVTRNTADFQQLPVQLFNPFE